PGGGRGTGRRGRTSSARGCRRRASDFLREILCTKRGEIMGPARGRSGGFRGILLHRRPILCSEGQPVHRDRRAPRGGGEPRAVAPPEIVRGVRSTGGGGGWAGRRPENALGA